MFAASRKRSQRSTTSRLQFDHLEQRAMLAADLGFTPLDASADTLSGANNGGLAPYDLAPEFSQTIIQRRGNLAGSDPDLGILLGQNTINENGPSAGRFLFTTAQETTGDGIDTPLLGTVNRTDLATGQTINLLEIALAEGQTPGESSTDVYTLQNLRAIRWTPWGTLLVGEGIDSDDADSEGVPIFSPDDDGVAGGSSNGLVYEIFNPTSNQPTIVARPAIGSANFQGLDFDSQGNLYYTDNNDGDSTVHRFVSDGAGETPLESGEVQVLFVPGSFGDATWVSLDPLDAAIDVRLAVSGLVDPDGATFFNTARDLEVGFANFGEDEFADETLYVALQGDNSVIAVDLDGTLGDPEAPVVYNFVDASIDADFNDPVDIAVDAEGRVYIGEAIDPFGNQAEPDGTLPDPNDPEAGNDVWVANDVDDDVVEDPFAGVLVDDGDELGRLASLRVSGASVAGLYVNPFNNGQIYVNVSSSTANKNAIVRFNGPGATEPSVIQTPDGMGGTILTIIGTEASDRIIITGNNLLHVRIGTQVFKGLSPTQNVIVFGLGGDDFITTSTGTFFDFTIFGGTGSDYIATGKGNDSIAGEEGNDRISGGEGDNVLSGGAGSDSLTAGKGNDVLSGDAGNDRLTGNAGNDTFFGGDGNDLIGAGLGDDFLDGGAGNDNMNGYVGNDLLLGGPGNDFLRGGIGQDVLIGGSGADQLYGDDGEDLLIGDTTAADGDETSLRGLAELWSFAFFADDRAQQVLDFLDDLDGDDNDDGIVIDFSRDLLDGGRGLDLFFRFGNQDVAQRILLGDEVVDLS